MTDNEGEGVASAASYWYGLGREESTVDRMRTARWWAALALVGAMAAGALGASGAGAASAPVTAGGVQAQQPSVSGTRVVWSDYRGGQWDIWLYDAVGMRARRVTSGPGDKVAPSVSGDTVVYVVYSASSKGDVWIYDIPTGMSRCLSVDGLGRPLAGDQLNPVVNGPWVAWEDQSSSYNNSKIYAYNLEAATGFQVAGQSTKQFRRPRIFGSKLVYESAARDFGQGDVMLCDLNESLEWGGASNYAVATSAADERLPVTDGRYVVWVQASAGSGYDIWAKDLQTDELFPVSTAPGEQTLPVVANGTAYWTDTAGGVAIKFKNLNGGTTALFPWRSRTEVSGLAASADALAWLQPSGDRWTVKVMLGTPVAGVSVASVLPGGPAWSAFRFAVTSAGGDNTAPMISSASVTPGATGMDGSQPLRVHFSEPMSPTSINSKTVMIRNAKSGAKVGAKVRYSSLLNAAIVAPVQPLDGSYTLAVSPSVTDVAGNAVGTHFAATFSTAGESIVAALPPDRVNNVAATIVDATGRVKVTWDPSVDPDGDMVGYQVKRFLVPASTPASWSAAATITPESGPMTIASSATSATFAPAADEVAKTSVYYYAVVAVDAQGNYSSVWYNASPNPHGGEVIGMNTNTCLKCHGAHTAASGGMLGARGPEECYACHGGTSQGAASGIAAVNNVQAQFFDYPYTNLSPAPPAAPSRHGNEYTRQAATAWQCDMCHAPHKRSYNANQSLSYRKLLKRSQVANDVSSTPVVYSADNAPMGKVLCLQCHGAGGDETTTQTAPYSNMYQYGGPTAYSNTAGEHNGANWDGTTATVSAAHGTQSLNDVTRTLPYGGSLPSNACQVCHAEHGSESRSLLAYRRSSVTTQLDEAGLCFKCHADASQGAEETQAPGARPYTWNGRSPKREFERTSSHPISTSGSKQVSTSFGGFAQSTSAELNTGTKIQTVVNTADGNGSAVLNTYVPVTDPASQTLIFGHQGAGTAFDQMQPGSGWNTNNSAMFDPANSTGFSPNSGSSAVTVNNKVYVTAGDPGTASAARWVYTPPSNSGVGSWATASSANAVIGIGADSVVDRSRNYVYYLRGNSGTANNDIMKWNFATDTWDATYLNDMEQPGTATDTNMGQGSALAYAPAANRLFAINRDGTVGNGNLYYLTSPSTLSGTQDWTGSAFQITTNAAAAYHSRMTMFRASNGTEYLMFIGRNTGNTGGAVTIVGSLGGTPAVLGGSSVTYPFGANALNDGTDLEWDGVDGGYIYAVRGGGSGQFYRIRIPANPATTWGTWESLDAPLWTGATWGVGSSITFAEADPPSYTGASRYYDSGSLATVGDITPNAAAVSWDTLTWTEYDPSANTTVVVDVQSDQGSGYANVPGFTNLDTSPVDLSSLSVASYPKLRLIARLSTSNGAETPRLDDWSVTSKGYVTMASGTSSCYSCHNTHFVAEGTAGTAWQPSRISNPQDTSALYSGTTTDFCLGCHGVTAGGDGSVNIAASTNANTLVPFAIGMRATTVWPFFTGWNKGAAGYDFRNSGHFTTATNKALCENCHDPHGSNNDSLLAWTRPASFAAGRAGTRDNTSTAAFESNICWECHGNSGIAIGGFTGRTATGAGGVRMDIATPSNRAYDHNTAISGKHSDAENATALGAASRHAECVDCHDPHATKQVSNTPVHTAGQSAAGGALLGAVGVQPTFGVGNWASPTGFTTVRMNGSATSYEAYVCFKCHTSYTTLPTTGGSDNFGSTNLAQEFNPDNQSGHNVMGNTSVWPKSTVASGLPWAFSAFPTGTFTGGPVAASGVNYRLTCTECHTSDSAADARGPHGSASKFMLKSGGTTNWYDTTLLNWTNASNFCNDCHGTRNSNNVHSTGNHDNYPCSYCHVKIPHGWKRPRLLVYQPDTDGTTQAGRDAAPYSSLQSNGVREIAGQYRGGSGTTAPGYRSGANSWSQSDCYAGCDTGRHMNQYSPWP